MGAGVRSLRAIADLHPAVFSVSNWSAPHAPAGTRQQSRPAEPQTMAMEAEHRIAGTDDGRFAADMRSRPAAEQPSAERSPSKLIVKPSSND
jgi:hypothetical protein